MKQYIKITRSDVDGSCVQPFEMINLTIDGELDGIETGASITLTIIEMDENEYDKLPEFQGW